MTGNAVTTYQPENLQQLEAFAERLAKSGIVSQQYRGKPNDVLAACLWGWETAQLTPMTALAYIDVIQGRAAYKSEGLVAIALRKGFITDVEEEFTGNPGTDEYAAVCTVTKKSGKTLTRKFSVADAKKAQLFGKENWNKYLDRMLIARARGFAVRDAAPHAMLSYSAEEARDIAEAETHRGPEQAKDVTPGLSPHEAAEQAQEAAAGIVEFDLVDEFGEHNGTFLTAKDWLTRYGQLKREAGANACYVARANLSVLRDLAITAKNGIKARLDAEIEAAEAVTGEPSDALEDELEMEAAE
jgi:hypothetical protein